MPLRIEGSRFVDEEGRTVQFRGINLSGESKMPSTPCGFTWRRDNLDAFYRHREVSFVGRPFPLSNADEHYARLRQWGYTLLRFVITWEAVEHAGPGIYDDEYLTYLRAVVAKAHDYGFWVWIDPHQDAWSRFTGGSGAPGWTLEAAGFDLPSLATTGAAMVHQTHRDDWPHMVWPTNYTKLACATMFMLFYGGGCLAPNTRIRGQSIQEYLQRHYVACMQKVVGALAGLPHVVGYGVMNEPNMGWIGIEDLNSYKWELTLGPCLTPMESLRISSGLSVTADVYDHGKLGFKHVGTRCLNPRGARPWRPDMPCVWEANGVVRRSGNDLELLRPHHFAKRDNGEGLNFYSDFYVPFMKRFAAAIHELQPDAWIFVEDAPFSPPGMPELHLNAAEAAADKTVCADHWYDGIPLVTGSYRTWLAWDVDKPALGWSQAEKAKVHGVKDLHRKAQNMGGRPLVVGETGIPFGLHHGKSFKTNNFRAEEQCMDGVLVALEVQFTSSTIWNYCPNNSNAHGDNWNGEDLSIYSQDQKTGVGGLDDGGRAIVAAVRPHARAYSGTALVQEFNMDTKEFVFKCLTHVPRTAPNVFFIPRLHYDEQYQFKVSDGTATRDLQRQLLLWTPDPSCNEHSIRVWDPRVRAIRPLGNVPGLVDALPTDILGPNTPFGGAVAIKKDASEKAGKVMTETVKGLGCLVKKHT